MDESLKRGPATAFRFGRSPDLLGGVDRANFRTKATQRFCQSIRPLNPKFTPVFAEQARTSVVPLAGGPTFRKLSGIEVSR
jgi:hypothetical protein